MCVPIVHTCKDVHVMLVRREISVRTHMGFLFFANIAQVPCIAFEDASVNTHQVFRWPFCKMFVRNPTRDERPLLCTSAEGGTFVGS